VVLALFVLAVVFVPNYAYSQTTPELYVTVGDTVGSPGEVNSVITVYLSNPSVNIFAFEMYLTIERDGIVYFQTDSSYVTDTTYWKCVEMDGDSCTKWVAGEGDTTWWKCIGYDEVVTDSCIDSVQVGPDDPWEWRRFPDYDSVDYYSHWVTHGSMDTTGSLISGWEDVRSRSFNPDGRDLKITATSNVNFTDHQTPPMIPAGQAGGVLFRLLGDLEDLPDTASIRDSRIVVLSRPADNFIFSRANGTPIGLSYRQFVDTNYWRCEYWSGDECLSWKEYSTPPYDSLEIYADSQAFVDTTYPGHVGKVVLNHGSVTILGVECGNVDADPDNKLNLADITFLIAAIYLHGTQPDPRCIGNTDCDIDQKLTLADITKLIDRVYLSKTPLCENCCY
jgi:hypothetical protein